MSKFQKIYDAIAEGKTLLGVGPMSWNCVNAACEIANDHDIPIKIICSRRQVDSFKLGGGYVAETSDLARHIEMANTKGNIFLARDHGGPWQGSGEQYLLHTEALQRACDSYIADIQAGFDILHLDPSLKARELKTIIDDIQVLYEVCERHAQVWKKDIIYEAGTEEHSGQTSNITNFTYFVQEILQNCPKIKFVVGNMGLWVKEIENVGNFDEFQAKELVSVCNRYDLYLKGHNSDYVGDEILKKHPKLGIHSINVAPEFGVRETEELLFLFEFYRMEKQRNKFIELAVKSNKWHKWMKDWKEEVPDLYKAKICGHYIFETDEVKELKEKLRKKCNLDELLKNSVKDVIKKYLYCLGWEKELEMQ